MAPEQIERKPRPSSDQYSLGIVLYEWLAGERPFEGTLAELFKKHLTDPPPPLLEKVPTLPPDVEQVVMTALNKDLKDRFGSIRAFAIAFEQACPEPSTSPTPSTSAPGALPSTIVLSPAQTPPRISDQILPNTTSEH